MDSLRVEDLGTILSIWAHPDDETYLAGGLMAAAVTNGQRVVCVTATDGERGTDDPRRWPPEVLGPVRRLEASAAMAVLGVGEHRTLGLPDGKLDRHGKKGAALVRDLIEEVRPDTVVSFGPDGITFHPDHIAVHRWVGDACERRRDSPRLLHAVWSTTQLDAQGDLMDEQGVFMGDGRPVGVPEEDLHLHVVVEGFELERKLVALRAMATQTAGVIRALGEDVFADHVAEECFVTATPATRSSGAAITPPGWPLG